MDILNSIGEALTGRNIFHNSLIYNSDKTLNYGVTDNENIFCKVAPINQNPTKLTDLGKELSFRKNRFHGIHSLTPAYKELIEFEHESKIRYMSVWQWEEMVAYSSQSVTKEVLVDSLNKLQAIHNARTEGMPVLNSELLLKIVMHRIDSSDNTDVSKKHITVLKALVSKYYNPNKINLSNPVLIHGDCHIGNFVKTNDGNKWIDFEALRIAPAEWDYAGIYLSVIDKNFDIWRKVRTTISIDEEKFLQAVTIKQISNAAFMLLQPETYPLFEKKVDALAYLLNK
jgi:hypothetical protein